MTERLNLLRGDLDPNTDRPSGSANHAETGYDATTVSKNPMVVLICPNETHRSQLKRLLEADQAKVAAVYDRYPGYDQLPGVLDCVCDAYIIDIDSDQDLALDLVETICSRKPSSTVMVYSEQHDTARMASSMRVGAREFLSASVPAAEVHEALMRAAARSAGQAVKKAVGTVIVFWGAKGGSGVSTLAANFAMALRTEAAAPVLLADLNPQLGELSVLLGVTPRFTVAEALKNSKRLDAEFLSTLVTKHKSGVSFVAAPDVFTPALAIEERAVAKFVDLARNQYPWVVIDAGRSLGSGIESLLQMANTIYLVTQLDIPSLHGAQRFIAYMQSTGGANIEVVVNRYDSRRLEFDDERVAKALGLEPKWKVPNDYAAAYRASNTGNPLILEKSPAASALRALARSACGKELATTKKKNNWSLFR
jgi:pilus assembly protein CpaE